MQGGLANGLILIGVLLVLAGLLVKTGAFGWFGHLPGDISVERNGFRFYLPITSMILISVVVSVLLGLIRRFF